MRRLIRAVWLGLLLSLPATAASGSVLCIQHELAELGYDPGPADGLMGRRTLAAAAEFSGDAGLELPALSEETSALWCDSLGAFARQSAGPRMAAAERAVLPKAELITVSRGSDPSRLAVAGTPGAVAPDHRVFAVNLNTGDWSDARADGAGAFSMSAPGADGAAIEVYSTAGQPPFATHLQDFRGLGTVVYADTQGASADAAAAFVTSGGINRDSGQFVFRAEMDRATYPSGARPVLSGELTLESPAIGPALDGTSFLVRVGLVLAPLSDAEGRPNFMPFDHLGFSPLLTPTGLGIKGISNLIRVGEAMIPSSAMTRVGSALNMQVSIATEGRFNIPDGYYAVALELAIGRNRARMQSLIDNELLRAPDSGRLMADYLYPHFTGAAIQVGTPVALRVPWVLLWNTLDNGSRGVVADEDQPHFSLRNKVVFEAPHFIVPREDELTGDPIAYRLEPFVPTLFQNTKANVHPPPIRLALPSGMLRVTVERPDGTVDELGEAPFRQFRLGEVADAFPSQRYGETSVMTPLELTTLEDRFSYVFEQHGRHVVTLAGSVSDAFGHTIQGGGRYEIWVARPLNVVETGVLLGTPFEVGDFFAPTVRVEPGVPAEVEIEFALHRNSSPVDVQRHRFAGTASRYGYFHSQAGSPPLRIDAPGEYVTEITARYEAPDGTLWMGSRRGANVVETPNGQLVAHGRRGASRVTIPNRPQWFFLDDYVDSYRSFGLDSLDITFPVPFGAGDVTWAADLTSNRRSNREIDPVVRLQDLRGDISSQTVRRYPGHFDMGQSIQSLATAGEMPMFTYAPVSSSNPVPRREDYRLWSYFYHVTMRPGVGVRAILNADDHGGIGKYWTFGDPYNLQPGVGPNGDLPGDIKAMFGGGVYRDLDRGINEYAIHGSMAVIVDNDDPMGERTTPPFRGAGGGPDGGPLLTIHGDEVDLFVTPTGVRPGEVLEVGDTFAFAGQFWPLLPSLLEVNVTSPSGQARSISARANKVGYVYDPASDFVVGEAGRWTVEVLGTHDGPISSGSLAPPYPSGGVLGRGDGTYEFYVVPRRHDRPIPSVVEALPSSQPLVLETDLPTGTAAGSVRYTVGMPGLILDQGTLDTTDGGYRYVYDPVTLHEEFANIDIRDDSNRGAAPVAVDTVTFTFLIEDGEAATIQRALLAGDRLIQDEAGAFSVLPPLTNVARGASVRASRSLASEPAERAIDGDAENWWGAGDGPAQWIEIAFDDPTEVHEIALVVSQFPAGETAHRVQVRTAAGMRTVHEFVGPTDDLDVLSYSPVQPVADVTAVRIETVRTPSWVAWREITVMGRR